MTFSSLLSNAATDKRVLGVLVVHGRGLDQVDGWPMLYAELGDVAAPVERLRLSYLLVYDNSPQPLAAAARHVERCIYVHDPANGGTAAAYRCATLHARSLGADWLLLLDQDTKLPPDFLGAAQAALLGSGPSKPAALLPRVLDGNVLVSPARISWTGSLRPCRAAGSFDPAKPLTGVASGSFVNVNAMLRLSWPSALWLDYVDHWLFMQLRLDGGVIATFDAELQHHLSLRRPEELSRRRLHSILDGEALFTRLLPWPARLIYPARLALRLLRRLRHPAAALDMLAWFGRRPEVPS